MTRPVRAGFALAASLRCTMQRTGIVLLFATLAGCGGGDNGTSASAPNSATLSDTIDNIVHAEMQQSGIPAMAVGLAKGGLPVYVKSYGLADVETGEAAMTGTIFELASLTKQFTATLVLQLQESGRLHMDDKAATYLPQYGLSPSITIRMLLNHTSGLADYLSFPAFQNWYVAGVPDETVLTAIGSAALDSPPGTAWAYSNSNYFVLGAIIEQVTGQSYAVNLQQRIFTPFGLTSAHYDLPPAPPAALGYSLRSGTVAPVRLANRSALFAAGAVSADVNDVLNWDHALFSSAVLSAGSFEEMTTPAAIGVGDGSYYGFGLFLDIFRGRRRTFHTGDIDGFLAYNEVFLDNGFSLVVLMNGDFVDQQALGDRIYDAVCGSPTFTALC